MVFVFPVWVASASHEGRRTVVVEFLEEPQRHSHARAVEFLLVTA